MLQQPSFFFFPERVTFLNLFVLAKRNVQNIQITLAGFSVSASPVERISSDSISNSMKDQNQAKMCYSHIKLHTDI